MDSDISHLCTIYTPLIDHSFPLKNLKAHSNFNQHNLTITLFDWNEALLYVKIRPIIRYGVCDYFTET